MTPIQQLRKSNLRRLIDDQFDGRPYRFAKHCGKKHGHIFRLLGPNSTRTLGERLARDLEASCELTAGWLDTDHDAPQVECLLTHRIKRLSADDRGKLMWVVQLLEESA